MWEKVSEYLFPVISNLKNFSLKSDLFHHEEEEEDDDDAASAVAASADQAAGAATPAAAAAAAAASASNCHGTVDVLTGARFGLEQVLPVPESAENDGESQVVPPFPIFGFGLPTAGVEL